MEVECWEVLQMTDCLRDGNGITNWHNFARYNQTNGAGYSKAIYF